MVDIPCVITCAKFGDDRLRGLGVAWGSNFALSHWLWLSSLQQSRTAMQCVIRSQEQNCCKSGRLVGASSSAGFLVVHVSELMTLAWWHLTETWGCCLQRILSFLHQQEMLLVDTADNLARMARETLVHARYPCTGHTRTSLHVLLLHS